MAQKFNIAFSKLGCQSLNQTHQALFEQKYTVYKLDIIFWNFFERGSMNNDRLDVSTIIQKLVFGADFSIDKFRQALYQIDSQYFGNDSKHRSIIFSIIETLIVQEKFYDHFSLLYYNSSIINHHNSAKREKDILSFGFKVIQEVFSRPQLVENDIFILSPLIKKCKIDIFLLIAICKGYLKNTSVKRDKVKSFFLQNFKKSNQQFVGLQTFSHFHQSLVEKLSQTNYFTADLHKKEKLSSQYTYFLDFYSISKDFFPSTLQIDNSVIRMMISIKLDTQEDISLYDRFQKLYLHENSYHLITTCKNIRFIIQFFRNSFNQKSSQFYPQKTFLRLLGKYSKTQIEKIISFSEVGLSWSEDQISTAVGNIFKLGLVYTTFCLFKSLLQLWLKTGLLQIVLKIAQTYIPKTFIFLKHQNLFNISLAFLKEFTLGPKNPTKGIMNKLLQKILIFIQKQCPLSKKYLIHEFISLFEIKYEKVATLQDKLFIELKKFTKNLRDTNPQSLPKDEFIQQKLKQAEWQEIKVPLFGTNQSTNQKIQIIGKQVGQYKGLYNIGNSCYMNSFLQCLYMNIQFRKCILDVSTLMLEKNLLQKLQKSQQKNDNEKQVTQLNKNIQIMARQFVRPTAELQRLFAQLTKSKRSAISPLPIKNVSSPEFKNTFQQDTIEFGRSFIEIISKSSLNNIFQGEQTNEIICPNCQKSRFKKENFVDLMLTQVNDQEQKTYEIASTATKECQKDGIVIEQMLEKFFKPQQMEGLECDFCHKKSQKSIKKHFISKFPNYLILTMKRFDYNVKENKNIKKHFNVHLKEGFINLEGQNYQLYGIIVHRGQSANSGHYFSFCREWKFQNEIQTIDQENKVNQKSQVKMIDESQNEGPLQQKMEIEQEEKLQQLNHIPQSNSIKDIQGFALNKDLRWLCLNDSTVSVFESFQKVKQFLELNQQDTPYILFYEKVSHIISPECKHLKEQIKLRQPLQNFLEKDNIEYMKLMENKKRGNQNSQRVDWKNFGKVKGFTAYDYFKLTRDDEDNEGGGNSFGGGIGNNPIL